MTFVRGFLEVRPLEEKHVIDARDLLVKLTTVPLRTLDALHLAIAIDIAADGLGYRGQELRHRSANTWPAGGMIRRKMNPVRLYCKSDGVTFAIHSR